MHLTFTNAALKALVADAETFWPKGTRPVYGQPENPPPGFWMVGDEGVYLMHNGARPEGDSKSVVAYAVECNPKTLPFDDWWEMKRATFGGDDGVEYLEPDLILACACHGRDLRVNFTPDSMTFEMGPAPKVRT